MWMMSRATFCDTLVRFDDVEVCGFSVPSVLQVEDLGRLIDLYADWHSRLIPYYSFNQFVQKVEQVGASKRVRVSVNVSWLTVVHF